MRYTEKDIHNIWITQFLDALGEKPEKEFDDFKLDYAPYRDDPEPMLCVNDSMKRWYDEATDQVGNHREFAILTARGDHTKDITSYILKMMNENERAKEMLEAAKRPLEPSVITLDIRHLPLSEFMKDLGQEQPVYADGKLRRYNTPYSDDKDASMVVNIQINQWRDVKTEAYGGIYDLAYELTGSCSMSELNHYIAGEMSGYKQKQQKVEPSKQEPDKSLRKMRIYPMDIDAIKQISLVDRINHLGYQQTGRDSRGLWFLSPCRSERKPSFHVIPP